MNLSAKVFSCVCLLAASAFAADSKLVVRNGGMTQGLSIPAEWNGKFGDCTIARDTKVFKEGPASLRVDVAGGKSGQAFQSQAAHGGETFKIAGWVKSAGHAKVNVAVQSFDEKFTRNDFQQLKYVQDETDWTSFEKEVKLPDWAHEFHILLLVEGDGSAWLDEVHEAGSPVDPGTPTDPLTSEPAPPGKPWDPGWGFYPQFPQAWQLMHKSFLERTAKGDIDIIFFGDSITQGWDKEIFEKRYVPLKAVNYGIGGDSTRQVLWRLEHGEVAELSPKLVVLMIGTNNLYGDQNGGTDEEIARGITRTVQTIREKLPKTKVLLLAILPRQNEYFSTRVRNINAIIQKLDDGTSVRYLDMGPHFEESLGHVKKELFTPDQLHLVEAGYEVWADQMQTLFEQMIK